MNFFDEFDPNNKDHLRAFQYMRKNGEWPEGFGSAEFRESYACSIGIAVRLADRYCEEALADKEPSKETEG